MKRNLLLLLLIATGGFAYGQTYYWVGGASISPVNISTAANWNTAPNGTGSPRSSNLPSTGGTDILVFDGLNANIVDSINLNASISCAQMKFINNANIVFVRSSTGTSTVIIAGTEAGDDFLIENGSTLSLNSYTGSTVIFLQTGTSGRVRGNFNMVTILQARICNINAVTPAQPVPATLVFENGSTFRTNITSSSAAYAFGSSTQSTEKWASFEAGSHLYFEGGFSPNGSGNLFSAIDMKPGSFWHHRATNGITGFGNFFNRKSYGNIVVENNSNLIALGPVYRIENLTINAGSSFTTSASGQTVILGDIVAHGNLTSDAASTNEVILAGNAAQNVSGAGAVNIASLSIADNANVALNKDVSVDKSVTVLGKLNFKTYKLTGNATFAANGPVSLASATGNLTAGSYMITGVTGVAASSRGLAISGAGIAPNTSIVLLSANNDTVYISSALVSAGTAVPLSIGANGAVMQNNNTNGYDPATGSVAIAGNRTYNDGINYIVDGASSTPFGVSTASSATAITAKFIEINAPVTVNRAFSVSDHLTVNGKITLRPLDIVHVLPGAVINGSFNATNYIATVSNSTTGEMSSVQYDGISSSVTLPIGSANYFLPVVLNPSSASNFTASVFEGITTNGNINGTQLTALQKQTVVNATWNINRLSGTGNADLQFTWDPALEGSTFTTLPNTDIGMIVNTGSSWSLPMGTANNTTNTASTNTGSFGSFSAGAVPQVDPFVFNTLPVKTYGDVDFNGGATSLNTTQPIVYTSSNPAVATIVGGNIHITGAGTATITAAQASDGFYPAASIGQSLTVNKATLTITADSKTRFEGQPNPTLTITYTGFVYSETSAVLLTPTVISTTATVASAPGTYPITVTGATAANYTISFVNGTLTVQAKQNQTITFNTIPTKTYGNADFATVANSTNNTIPITYASSNPAVATINASGIIHITGGGTATITASQAGNVGYFPAPDVARTLTVNKAALAIRVRDTTKVQGQPNPVFTIVYTGFVMGETVANLATPPTVNTAANTNSPAGYYTLTPEGAVTNNYNITYTAGRLTIYPPNGTGQSYMHAYMKNSTTLTVRVYSTYPALADIVLYDLSGKPLLKKNVFLPQGFINADLDVSLIPSGVYVVTVRGSGVDLKKTIPIIKQ
jgi:hypothetical protein